MNVMVLCNVANLLGAIADEEERVVMGDLPAAEAAEAVKPLNGEYRPPPPG